MNQYVIECFYDSLKKTLKFVSISELDLKNKHLKEFFNFSKYEPVSIIRC